FADSIYAVEKARRHGAAINAKQLAEQYQLLVKQLPVLSKKLAAEPAMNIQLSDRAFNTVKGLQAAMRSIFEFYNTYDPNFTWWMPLPYRSADSALTSYANELKAKGKS